MKFLERNKIRFVEFWLATPYPGTPMWRKYKAKNRILTEDFDLYNGAHCVFQPKKMTKEEMEEYIELIDAITARLETIDTILEEDNN